MSCFSLIVNNAKNILSLSEDPRHKVLVVADENSTEDTCSLRALNAEVVVLTNRYDVYTTAKNQQLEAHFNDYGFSSISAAANKTFDLILYRISKERPVCHHVLNQCAQALKPGAKLLVSGKKNVGIKG